MTTKKAVITMINTHTHTDKHARAHTKKTCVYRPMPTKKSVIAIIKTDRHTHTYTHTHTHTHTHTQAYIDR